MADPVELMLAALQDRYSDDPVAAAYLRIYADEERFGAIFASLHERLNNHFKAINDRIRSSRHYWADSSRSLIALIDEMDRTLATMRRGSYEVTLLDVYTTAVDNCRPWLSSSGGSGIPEEFEPIEIIEFEPVFIRPDTTVKLQKASSPVSLQLIGHGSYAKVFSYIDPDYGVKFAVKRADKKLDERDLERFKKEFNILKNLSYPYVVEVYRYDDDRNEYTMEFCDEPLRKFISRRNNQLRFATRKRVALQFLYGMNYLHRKGLLHRDISLQNVLVKIYDDGAVLVKLSDFGLVKDRASVFTRTKTEMRGSILDPQLGSFKDYGVPSEVYSIGWVLSYIFTGREALAHGKDDVSRIVQKCTAADTAQRYPDVRSLIAEVELLEAVPTDSTA